MTDLAELLQSDNGQPAHAVHLVDKNSFEDWLKGRPADDRALLKAHGFDGTKGYAFVILPRGEDFEVVSAVANVDELSPWCMAKLAESLPEGRYRREGGDPGKAALGWILGQYRFAAYRKADKPATGPRILLTGQASQIAATVREAEATFLVRDLVNMPASDLGPAELEDKAREAVAKAGGEMAVVRGDELESGYPLIAAVGAAAAKGREPRLIEARWGNPAHPKVAIVGKGVCFDSGGLDIKGAAGMRLMKKDMGGAAHALALFGLVAAARLPVRLHLLIPAVENSVSGNAFRPGDIVRSRKGLTVEIDNTDAEGRLVLADAFTRAGEEEPELLLDFATLTGAARVALGPDLPALFTSDDALGDAFREAADATGDPVWRLPLWDPYLEMLNSDVADMANSANSPMAGAVVAAMFLKRFVPDGARWAHCDTFAWRDKARPGRPKGGDALGLRAFAHVLARAYPRA